MQSAPRTSTRARAPARREARRRRTRSAGRDDPTRARRYVPTVTAPSPRDRFITVYGRRPVFEALADDSLTVEKVLIAGSARGPEINAIERAARGRGVEC